jgi:hypothetical protein
VPLLFFVVNREAHAGAGKAAGVAPPSRPSRSAPTRRGGSYPAATVVQAGSDSSTSSTSPPAARAQTTAARPDSVRSSSRAEPGEHGACAVPPHVSMRRQSLSRPTPDNRGVAKRGGPACERPHDRIFAKHPSGVGATGATSSVAEAIASAVVTEGQLRASTSQLSGQTQGRPPSSSLHCPSDTPDRQAVRPQRQPRRAARPLRPRRSARQRPPAPPAPAADLARARSSSRGHHDDVRRRPAYRRWQREPNPSRTSSRRAVLPSGPDARPGWYGCRPEPASQPTVPCAVRRSSEGR